MNTLLVVVMLASLLLVHEAEGAARCFNWREMKSIKKMMSAMRCDRPTLLLVDLQVPQDYTSVMPPVALVPQCGGMICGGRNRKCVPTNTTSRHIKVEAMTPDMQFACLTVPVEEHLSCDCVCDMKMNCSPPMVADGTMCMCKCPDALQKDCPDDGRHSWSSRKCSCDCIQTDQCAHPLRFNDRTCKCESRVV